LFPGWDLGIGEGKNKGIPYFYHTDSGKSVWHHPEEGLWKKRLESAREKLQAKRDQQRNNPSSGAQARQQQQSQPVKRTGADDSKRKEEQRVDDGTEIVDFSDSSSQEGDRNTTSRRGQDRNKIDTSASKKPQQQQQQHSVPAGFGMQATDFFDDEPVINERVSLPARKSDTVSHNANQRDKDKGWETDRTRDRDGSVDRDKDKALRGWAEDIVSAGSNRPSSALSSADNDLGKRGKETRPGDREIASVASASRTGNTGFSTRGQDNFDRERDRQRERERENEREREREQQTAQRESERQELERLRVHNKDRERDWEHEKEKERELAKQKEREREKDRERERTERDRRERELEQAFADRSTSRTAALDSDVLSLNAEVRRLKLELEDSFNRRDELTKRSDGEIDLLRGLLAKAEDRLTREKEDRRISELKLVQLQSEVDSRLRDAEESVETRFKEAMRRFDSKTVMLCFI
jgi:hypothetical protein